MKYNHYFLSIIAICSLFLSGCSKKPATVTMETLLQEMTDRDALARFPEPSYVCKQFSSYDRQTVAPDKPGWFANSDKSEFIRTETNEGRREFVLFDADGPGAVVRFWVTVAAYGGNGTLRFYLDEEKQPAIEGEVLKLLSGGELVKEGPLATSVSPQTPYLQRGHNLYLPIPYAKHCKITYESASIIEPGPKSVENFYYNINYRTYEKSTEVVSFSKNDLTQYASLIDKVQQSLSSNEPGAEKLTGKSLDTDIEAGQSFSEIIEGSKAIRKLSLKLKAEHIEQALRSTVLQISFDGEQTVWCPVGDFFGGGYKLAPFVTHYTEVSADGTLSAYWVMPFRKNCKLEILNLGEQKVSISGEVAYSEWKWDSRSMHFGASWAQQTHLDTGKERDFERNVDQFDVNYVTLDGKGVLVGTSVVLFNTANAWWGEGDEKVYVDGETFPSHIGTGSEDYYGYAWGLPNTFSHPYIAQPTGEGAVQPGLVSNIRYRGLDAVPFTKSIRFDMEMWHWTQTLINHAPAAFWYGMPGTKSNIAPRPEDAKQPVALKRSDIITPVIHEKGPIEGESMEATATAGNSAVQSIRDINWSNDAQMMWTNGKPGDVQTLSFLMKEAGSYRTNIILTMSHDYGKASITLNGKTIVPVFDAYSPTVTSKSIPCGIQSINQGENIITIKMLDKNEKSAGYFFGIDCLELN